MTRKEAIKRFQQMKKILSIPNSDAVRMIEAIDMAIEALHREEAEEKGYCHRIIPSNVEVVVRCKDCEYKRLCDEDETKYYYCALEDRPNRNWSVDDTDYCSWGERREP